MELSIDSREDSDSWHMSEIDVSLEATNEKMFYWNR